MILKILKNNRSYNFILILILVGLLGFHSFLKPETWQFFDEGNKMPLFSLLTHGIETNVFINFLVPVVFIFLISLLLLRLNSTFPVIQEKTFLIPGIFVIILGGFVFLHTMHPVYFGTLFLLFSLSRIFSACTKDSGGLSSAFDAGFYIGVGSLFYFPLIFYFFVVWAGLFKIHGQLHGRYFILSLIGTLLPWLMVFSYYFFTDAQSVFNHIIYQNFYASSSYQGTEIPYYIYIGFLFLMIVISEFPLLSHVNSQKVVTRKYYGILFWIFIVSIAIFFLVPSVSEEIMVIIAVPLSFLFSNFMVYLKKEILGDIILIVFLGLIVWIQIAA